MKLGELIAIARECKGWTLRDLEKKCGVSNPLLSQIETGKVKDPGFATVVRIADALGISLERAASTIRLVDPQHGHAVLSEENGALSAQIEKMQAALIKIADLVDSDAGEPLDDAISIANKALGVTHVS